MCILPLLPQPVICQSLGYIYILFTVLASTKAVYHYPHILLKKNYFMISHLAKGTTELCYRKCPVTNLYLRMRLNGMDSFSTSHFLLQMGKIL